MIHSDGTAALRKYLVLYTDSSSSDGGFAGPYSYSYLLARIFEGADVRLLMRDMQ